MTKAQLVEAILKIREVDTKANLMKKSLAQLESLLGELEAESIDEPSSDTVAQETAPQAVTEDLMKAMKEQLMAEIMAEAKEKARQELEAEQKEVVQKKVEDTEVERFELIPVMNITNGQLIYTSKRTGNEFRWNEYGDIDHLEYQELLGMRTSYRRFFDEPFILVLDDRAVEKLGLAKMYENIKNPEQIDVVFNMNQAEFEDVVEKSPKGIKHLIVSRAIALEKTGELDSNKKIKYLNERFKTEIGLRG